MSDLGVLFTRPLWVDEWFTVLVASHASPLDVIADLYKGADGGPGLYHLLVWALGRVTELSPVALHTVSLCATIAALAFVYATLRRRFERDASIAGVAAVAANGLVLVYAFEGRFYALWLLCCALLAWALGAARYRRTLVAASAVLLTASHWYGVITLVAMCAAVFATFAPRWRQGLRFVAPAAAGLVAFAALAPLAAAEQSVLTIPSWVPDFRFAQITALSDTFWFAWPPVLAFLAPAALVLVRGRSGAAFRFAGEWRDTGIAALLALAVMPLALVALSLVGRPSMIARYALPAALAWGPWVAFMFSAMGPAGRWPARVFAIAMAAMCAVHLDADVRQRTAFRDDVARNATALADAERLSLPIVFHSQHTMYPLLAATLGKGSRAVYLDAPDSAVRALLPDTSRFYQLNKSVWLERDFARVHARLYGFPRLAPLATLDTTARFYFFAAEDRVPRGFLDVSAFARALFPHHHVVLAQPPLLLLELDAARNPRARSTSR